MSWPTFVDMIINNGVFSHPELVNMNIANSFQDENGSLVQDATQSKGSNVSAGDPVWYHWAPYWYHCGLCRPELRPQYILNMDSLGLHSETLLLTLGLDQLNVTMPNTMASLVSEHRKKYTGATSVNLLKCRWEHKKCFKDVQCVECLAIFFE